MNNLVRNISALAKREGISIRKLEQTLGFSEKLISSWEDHAPRLDKLVEVADFFHVTIDSLIDRENPLGEDEQNLLSDFRKLPQAGKNQLLQFVRFLLLVAPSKKDQAM